MINNRVPDGTIVYPIDELRDVIQYVERPLARTAGAGRFAYAQMNLPALSPIGPSTANLQFLRVMQPFVPTYMQVQTLQGLGGLQAGQMWRQPLATPDRSRF